jgi:hypothetical protein
MKKRKMKIIIIVLIIIIVAIIAGTAGYVLLNKPVVETSITENENLTFEAGTELKSTDLFTGIENGEIISEEEQLDTSKVGTYEYTLKYKDYYEEEQEKIISYEITDTTAPTIEGTRESIEIEEGQEVNLLEEISTTDNSENEVKLEVIGDYDINTPGEYELTIVATDEYENSTEYKFKLVVKEKPTQVAKTSKATTSSNSSNTSSSSKTSTSTSSSSNSTQSSQSPTISSDLIPCPYPVGSVFKEAGIFKGYDCSTVRSRFCWIPYEINTYGTYTTITSWQVWCDNSKVPAIAYENAKQYLPAAPGEELSKQLYDQYGQDAEYGSITLTVIYESN